MWIWTYPVVCVYGPAGCAAEESLVLNPVASQNDRIFTT
jgi:hypothetical protein